jgi:hypothetical protein
MNIKTQLLISNIVVFVLAFIGVILVVYAMGNEAKIDPITLEASSDTTTVSRAVQFSMALFYITVGAIGIFTLIAIITNPKRFIYTAIGFAVFGLLILIGYAMTGEETTKAVFELPGATPGNIKWSGVGIYSSYVLIAVALALIVIQIVRNLFSYSSK